MKLSEELRRCLDGDGGGCQNCERFETKSVLTCRGLLEAAYEQVKRNEELKEQDRIIELPVLIGGTVWDNDWGKPCSYTVTGFSFGKTDDEENDIEELQIYYRNWNGSIRYSCAVSEIGKHVFLSREAALQALKETEGENENIKNFTR